MVQQRLRIQLRPRWENEPQRPLRVSMRPVPKLYKLAAVVGITAFWLFYFGLLGDGGATGLEQGFLFFALAQMPLLWHWMRFVARLNRQ